jgi:hypothetical protein
MPVKACDKCLGVHPGMEMCALEEYRYFTKAFFAILHVLLVYELRNQLKKSLE